MGYKGFRRPVYEIFSRRTTGGGRRGSLSDYGGEFLSVITRRTAVDAGCEGGWETLVVRHNSCRGIEKIGVT